MDRNSLFRLFTRKQRASRSRRAAWSAQPPAELLETRTLLSATVPDAQDVPDNVSLTSEPGYFEVAVGVPAEVFDIDWPESPVDDTPILIDNGGIVPDDDLTVTEESPGDILLTVGMYGFPLAEMFGGELPDDDALNEFLANGPSEGGFLSLLMTATSDLDPDAEDSVGLEFPSFFSDGPLRWVSLHDDGIEVSVSLYDLMLVNPDGASDGIFSGLFGPGFDDEFEDGPDFEDNTVEDDSLFPDGLGVTVSVSDIPAIYLPAWLTDEDSDDATDDETELASFDARVPVTELMVQALFGAAMYVFDTNPDFEFVEPEDFEPEPASISFSLGVHLVEFGEPDDSGEIPELGIQPDYDYRVTLSELFGLPVPVGPFGTDGNPAVDGVPGTLDEDSEPQEEGTETVAAAGHATIRLSLEAAWELEIDTDSQNEPTVAPELVFDADNIHLVDGTLTVDLPEASHGGWTATADGQVLIFDFESEQGDLSHSTSLVGVTALVINGSQADDFVDLDLTELDSPELDSIALHGEGGDDDLNLIGAARDRFSEILLSGGIGDDFISVALTRAVVVMRGGDGDDVLRGGIGDDEIHGGAGDDLLDGGAGRDQIYGGRGDDVILGGGGHDSMWGGAGDDRIVGHAGRDCAYGGSGADTIMGGRGNDCAHGGSGDDEIDGGAGRDTLKGGAGADRLMGRSGRDRLYGGAGNDTVDGSSGNDTIKGGAGDDELRGGKGNDRMFGQQGRDRMFGSRGRDRMSGGDDDDYMLGNDGDDTLVGSRGNDIWKGGHGGNHEIMPEGPPVLIQPFEPTEP